MRSMIAAPTHRAGPWIGTLFTTVAVLLLGGSTISAECLMPTPEGVLAERSYELVFHGTVIEITRTGEVGYRATFEVDRVWKGSVSKRTYLYVWERHAEKPHFDLGHSYIAVGTRLGDGIERSEIGLTPADGVAFAAATCTDWFPQGFGEKLGPGQPPTLLGSVPGPIPVTVATITTAIGSDGDASEVLSLVFAQIVRGRQPGPMVVLSSQLKPEWLPVGGLVSFVFTTDTEVATGIANGGTFWSIDCVERTGHTVSMSLHEQCGSGQSGYVASFDGNHWQLGPPGTGRSGGGWVAGVGSGMTRLPAGCLARP